MGESETVAGDCTEIAARERWGIRGPWGLGLWVFGGKRRLRPPVGTMVRADPDGQGSTAPDACLADFNGRSTVYAALCTVTWGSK
jgi:hypothetical protein